MLRVKNNSGFTLVELLIVIVVVAILAAISIVSYRGVQERAHKSAVQQDLRNIQQKLNIYQVDEGHFPESTAQLEEADLTATKGSYDVGGSSGTFGNFYYCYNGSEDEYAIGVRAKGNQQGYLLASIAGVTEPDFQVSSSQTCQAAGLTSTGEATFWTQAMSSSGTWRNWIR